ncbi:hypothetical protein IGL98_003228 [Enterococcus sp. DIV0840]|uniref:winged helix-turn-helix domain-containing protein n=1 Tax=Enterococcus TaxID=1350 RepID=UPI001A8FBD7B|nr:MULTISPECIES: winged helix-turn-helix domain-containing protein [Enterococcus]MBO0436131.1 response regulator transcription factor [Enterococcus sp. DIV0849a]MBO0475297.1 response regulator transcription factor [Enterococcus ureasiticus]
MYNIGYIDLSGTNSDQYINVLSRECKLTRYDSSVFEEFPVDLDGFLIVDKNCESLFQVSDYVLKIRKQSNTFIWIVSRQLDSIAKVVFLKMGADDNFCSEQTIEEVKLKILHSLKRKQEIIKESRIDLETYLQKKRNTQDQLYLDDQKLILMFNDHEIEFTNIEFKVIKILFDKQEQVVTYEQLHEAIWKAPYEKENYRIATVIFHIREKIGKVELNAILIKTIRSKGYLLTLKTN